jgi:hypothetical protein
VRAGERLTLAGNRFEGAPVELEDVPTDVLELEAPRPSDRPASGTGE